MITHPYLSPIRITHLFTPPQHLTIQLIHIFQQPHLPLLLDKLPSHHHLFQNSQTPFLHLFPPHILLQFTLQHLNLHLTTKFLSFLDAHPVLTNLPFVLPITSAVAYKINQANHRQRASIRSSLPCLIPMSQSLIAIIS